MGKIHVYHHNDHDGIVAAGILYNHLKHFGDEFKFIMIDYDKELNFDHIDFEQNDSVYFLDYSFSSENNKKEFENLLKRRITGNEIVWIDHHKTSIGLFENYDILGIRNIALCGAAWTYLWCEKLYLAWLRSGVIDINNSEAVSNLFHYIQYDIPKFLKYIDDYDCWKGLYDVTNDFHYGLQISDPKDLDIEVLLEGDNQLIDTILKVGNSIQKYLKFNDKEYHIDMYGFEYSLPEEHGGLKCFCLNRKGNSIMFGDKINEYDAVIPFFYTDGKWKYSIFSNKEHIDCSEVAKSYGGGGHKGAAGWVIDEFIFKG